MDDRFEPVDIVVERTSHVAVTFADGHTARFDLLDLRRGCPCATCRSVRDQGQPSWPRPGSPEPLSVENASLHGAWGLNVVWNDGHSTGIYPFEALRDWSDGRPGRAR